MYGSWWAMSEAGEGVKKRYNGKPLNLPLSER
jgi:hypothetical protein